MNKKLKQPVSFFVRHAIACAISAALPVFVATILYLLLFILEDRFLDPSQVGLAGLPLMMLLVGMVSAGYTATLLFPSAALAELLSPRFGERKRAAEATIAIILLAVLSFAAGVTVDLMYDHHTPNVFVFYSFATFTVTAIPLFIYLAALKSAPMLIARAGSIFSKIRFRIAKR